MKLFILLTILTVPMRIAVKALPPPPDFKDGHAVLPNVCIDASDHSRAGRPMCTTPPKEWRKGWPLTDCQDMGHDKLGCAYSASAAFEDGAKFDGFIIVVREKCMGPFVPLELRLYPTNEKSQQPKRGGEDASL